MPAWIEQAIANPVVTYGATFVFGVLVALVGQYFADRFTDQRRNQESLSNEKSRFAAVAVQVYDLLREMQQDLIANPLLRELCVIKSTWVLNYSKPHLQYHTDKIDSLEAKMKILENNGYLQDTSRGNTQWYVMSEEFVVLLRGWNG